MSFAIYSVTLPEKNHGSVVNKFGIEEGIHRNPLLGFAQGTMNILQKGMRPVREKNTTIYITMNDLIRTSHKKGITFFRFAASGSLHTLLPLDPRSLGDPNSVLGRSAPWRQVP